MDLKHISKKYRPIPFWSWNEKLETEQTKEQIRKMHIAGMGGFFMHARGGLQTEYMGEEWFHNVTASIEAAKECGMRPWAYDENGWPSGFGDGSVNGLGVEYQQKYLRMEAELSHTETAICKCGEHYFYYDINPFYVDTLDKKVIAKFIEASYQPYYERYGTEIEGFFTDEPQVSRNGIPWSFVFEKEYKERYGENIFECLESLFLPIGDYKRTRVKFWKMVTELFSDAYMKQIYEWCNERGLKLTGHLTSEESLGSQITAHGACMPHYEYFHVPGMDWLGRDIRNGLITYQLSSVAEQLGKEEVLSETFGLCGHNVSFAEMKGIYEWQMVHGINLLCQHLEGYSIRGIRKRDYPPAMYVQQPWWEEYRKFVDSMSRIGMILREGKHPVDVLVLHPETTAWSLFDTRENKGLRELSIKTLETINELEKKHIAFHMGDEILLERHGKVENGKLVVGQCSYSYVITDLCCEMLLDCTEQLLQEFVSAGGQCVSVADLTEDIVIDNPKITYTKRVLEGSHAHYFVNTAPKREKAMITVHGRVLDIYTGELKAFTGIHEFEPWGSLVIIEDGTKNVTAEIGEATYLYPKEKLRIVGGSANSLTLDRCDYYFDGKLQEKNGYVLNIAERANVLERKVQIHQDYHVKADYVPDKLYLVCETPEKFKISVNGTKIEQKIEGCFVDYSFKKIEIAKYMIQGENTISFDCDFIQSEQFYKNRKKAEIFESEKNKLAYDIEIESIYLVGDFSVRTDGTWTALERTGMRYQGAFVLDKPNSELMPKHMEMQGYPFFCGELELEGKLDIQGEHPILCIDWKGINALKVEINGIEKTMLTDSRLPLDQFGVRGETKVKYTLVNNLRNLLGPHHLKEGECLGVGPGHFFKEPCIWNKNPEPSWNDDYCLVETGI